MKNFLLLLLWVTAMLVSCQPEKPEGPILGVVTVPMTKLKLEDLDDDFNTSSSNWVLAGNVFSDFQKEQDLTVEPGTNVLVNKTTGDKDENLFTNWDHSDMELELDFMMPKGSNSGVYLMGRYEIQLFDSWRVELPKHSDCGGIYQRWDEQAEEGSEGYEGHPPRINAAKAPGLWQHLYVKFIGPTFDDNGNKLSNARFEKVILNGEIIHEDVELTGPTRAAVSQQEVARAPLMLQGDHGNVAFRNIGYKRYFNNALTLLDLNYQYYHIEPSTELPIFDSLEMVSQGVADSFNIEAIADREDDFGVRFEGTILAPSDGAYVFKTVSDDGSKLYIDGKLVVSNDFVSGTQQQSGLIHLSAGDHLLRLDYYNSTWNKQLAVLYEGPEIRQQPLYSRYVAQQPKPQKPLIVKPVSEPELLRGFINYRGEKRTHTISVGDPRGINYTHDLLTGSLIKVWRGDFANVSNMWRNRGHSQLILPLQMSVDLDEGVIAAILTEEAEEYPKYSGPDLKPVSYLLDEQGMPSFMYELKQAKISDTYGVSEDHLKLVRSIKIEPGGMPSITSRIASADYIKLLDNGWYCIGGQYYIQILSEDLKVYTRSLEKSTELLAKIDHPATIKYSILW